jgi:beta-lactamase class D
MVSVDRPSSDFKIPLSLGKSDRKFLLDVDKIAVEMAIV